MKKLNRGLNADVTAEELEAAEEQDSRLAILKADFDKGPKQINRDGTIAEGRPLNLTWSEVKARLLKHSSVNPEKTFLELAAEMQSGGEFFGVDAAGNLLIKDRGNIPVMYGRNSTNNVVKIYDRDEDLMDSVRAAYDGEGDWADYSKIHDEVYGQYGLNSKPSNYEMFPYSGTIMPSSEVLAAEAFMDAPFVAKELSSHLDCGSYYSNVEDSMDVNIICGNGERSYISYNPAEASGEEYGVIRLLRVQ